MEQCWRGDTDSAAFQVLSKGILRPGSGAQSLLGSARSLNKEGVDGAGKMEATRSEKMEAHHADGGYGAVHG